MCYALLERITELPMYLLPPLHSHNHISKDKLPISKQGYNASIQKPGFPSNKSLITSHRMNNSPHFPTAISYRPKNRKLQCNPISHAPVRTSAVMQTFWNPNNLIKPSPQDAPDRPTLNHTGGREFDAVDWGSGARTERAKEPTTNGGVCGGFADSIVEFRY